MSVVMALAFVFGYTGSSCWVCAFSVVSSGCPGGGAWFPTVVASPAVARGPQGTAQWLWCWASLPCGVWNLPRPGVTPGSPHCRMNS